MPSSFWSTILAALVNAIAAISAACLNSFRLERAEHKRWLRNGRRQVSQKRSSRSPHRFGNLQAWYSQLAIGRKSLILLLAHTSKDDVELSSATKELFQVLDEFEYLFVASDTDTIEGLRDNWTGFVLLSVARIRKALDRTFQALDESAEALLRSDLLANRGGRAAKIATRSR